MPRWPKTTVYVEGRDYGKRWDFFVLEEGDETRALAKPLVFEKMPDVEGIHPAPGDATFTMTEADAQSFFEALWRTGFRSKHDRGSIDTLDAARKEHIADLRRAAFSETVTISGHDGLR